MIEAHSRNGSIALGARRRRLPRPPTPGAQLLYIPGIGLAALALGAISVRQGFGTALGLLMMPAMAWAILRPRAGLLVGITLILCLPYWSTLGLPQAGVLRVSSLAAATSILFVGSRPRMTLTDASVLLLVAVTVLGWILQYNEPHAGHIVTIELTPLGFYIGARAVSHRHLPIVMRGVLYAGTFGALTVLYEFIHGSPVFVDSSTYQWNPNDVVTVFRPGGVYGSPPGASTVLCFVILFGMASLRYTSGRPRWLGRICLAICVAALVTTFTRAAFIGLGVGSLSFLWLVRSPLLRFDRVAVAAICLVILTFFIAPILARSSTFQGGVLRSGNLTARETYWNWALPEVTSSAHTFFFGIGTASLETPQISATARVPSAIASVPQAYRGSLHSQYVTTLVEQGVIGLLAVVLFLVTPLVPAVRAARARRDPALAALVGSILAFVIVISVGTDFLHGPSFAMIMLATGLAAAAGAPRQRSRQAR